MNITAAMPIDCAGCAATIDAADVRYHRRDGDGATATYCSVNCLTGTDGVDEARARERIFSDRVEH